MLAITRAIPIAVFLLAVASASRANAQDLYEIQVYPYLTVPAGRTMVEVHSNYFASGTTEAGPEFPLHHQSHATLEVTHGFTNYFECAGYFVTAAHVPGEGSRVVGWRIRPRVRFPETPNLFFNIGVSFEFGFQQAEFEANTRTLEIRPISGARTGPILPVDQPGFRQGLEGTGLGPGIRFRAEREGRMECHADHRGWRRVLRRHRSDHGFRAGA